MRFQRISVDAGAIGATLGHSVSAGGARLHKGHILSGQDVAQLAAAGIGDILAARMEPGDVPEDEAARRLAHAFAGSSVRIGASFTGRANLYAERDGIVVLDTASIHAANAIDEALTLATLAPFEKVSAGDMVATIKVIPFAATEQAVARAEAIGGKTNPLVGVAAFRCLNIGLVVTRLPDTKASIVAKTETVVAERLKALGSSLAKVEVTAHHEDEIAPALSRLDRAGCDLFLVFGASAIVDRRDVIPMAIFKAGGDVLHFGMPVDPGNLLLLGRMNGRPVIGVPGCARSPKLNGFDWVLRRLCAGLEVTGRDIEAMGVGGLLKEISSRPQPRDAQVDAPRMPRIAGLILAAGRSTRMGPENKLLLPIGGQPMVATVAKALLASSAGLVTVVVGHQANEVRQALSGLNVRFSENPDFADGLATSLRTGIGALPEDCDGVIVCLGDMPGITGDQINTLIAAFNPIEGRTICVPTFQGKRGNPVLWGRVFFPELRNIKGDTGARHLIGEHGDQVREVPMATDAVLVDIDTPAAYRALSENLS